MATFEVLDKDTKGKITVFSVRERDGAIQFLIYSTNGFMWHNSHYYEPIDSSYTLDQAYRAEVSI